MDDYSVFINKLGEKSLAPRMSYYVDIYDRVDVGFIVQKYCDIDIEQIRDWYHKLEAQFSDYKYVCVENDDSIPYSGSFGKNAAMYKLTDDMFFDYAKEFRDSLPFKTGKWTLIIHDPTTRLATHQDLGEALRLHVPIYTNDDSLWYIEGSTYHMDVGNAYIVNTTIPHGLNNKGTTDRIHLYCKVWTDDVIKYYESKNTDL